MCGRFAMAARTKDIEKLVPGLTIEDELQPRYNIAPSQDIAAVLKMNIRSCQCYVGAWSLSGRKMLP